MNVETSINPLILIFDLDETLFQVQEKAFQKARNPLSESATNILSKSAEGIKTQFPLAGQFPHVLRADKVTAIAREKMKDVFHKIHNTNRLAESKGLVAPIVVKIMTTASYEEKHVKRLLDEFYFENDNPIRTGAFKIEYFNKNCLEGKVDVPTDKPTKMGTIDLRKAHLIDKKFEEWAKYLPGLTKDNVVLIDNADVNVVAVESLGFKAIHYPTTPQERIDSKSYTKDAPIAFEELDKLITKVTKAVVEHTQ